MKTIILSFLRLQTATKGVIGRVLADRTVPMKDALANPDEISGCKSVFALAERGRLGKASFRNFSLHLDFSRYSLFGQPLPADRYVQLETVTGSCGQLKPGQNRDKFSTNLAKVVFIHDRAWRRLRARKKLRGCIYTRFSTKYQHSTDAQLRKCREWADANDVEVSVHHVYSDEAVSGKTHKRVAFAALLKALEGDEFDIVITFATNRLFRKLYRSLAFVEEEIVDRGKRCVFVTQNIDTKQEFWRQLLSVVASHDEMMVQAIAGQVRAAHEGLLISGWVWGTLCFGYIAVAVEGMKTKLGRPRTTPWIDEKLKEWVLQIFRWFVDEGRLSYHEIARRLRAANVPPPPRVSEWTWKAVKYLLKNRRYVGDWSYGWTEAVWQNKAGYSRQKRREEPRLAHRVEGLRIVPNALFFAAQARIAERAGRGGRPSHKGGPRTSDPLVEVCRCPKHNRKPSVCGANGAQIACPECRSEPEDERALYSSINRKVGLRLLCATLAKHVEADSDIVARAIASARQCLEHRNDRAGDAVADMERELESLSRKIKFALANPGESETDQREQEAVIRELRGKRGVVAAKVEQAKADAPRRRDVPSEDELRGIVADLASILRKAAGGDSTPDEAEKAMSVILALTGENIVLSQEGEARRKGGWLRGHFQFQLLDTVLDRSGTAAGSTDHGPEIVIDFREPTEAEVLADEAKALFDRALLAKQIARELTEQHGRPISRNLVRQALDHWYASRGLGRCPDMRSRRSELEVKHDSLPMFQEIAPAVAALADEGLELQDIARRLGRDRNTITAAFNFWREQRGLPRVDGRVRRKELPRRRAV